MRLQIVRRLNNKSRACTLAAIALFCWPSVLHAQSVSKQDSTARWILHFPAVGHRHIVFVHANDLWMVPRDGGLAVPLTSSPEPESAPKFSPDGRTIAFAANYDGVWNLYTLPFEGGSPKQVTHHPASKTLCGWTGDDRLLFSSDFYGPPIPKQLFTVASNGGLPDKLPVPYGIDAAISADGKWLAYTMNNIPQTWKRYRGGNAPDIWIFNLQTKKSQKITDWEGVDSMPMWNGNSIYYLSDAGKEHRRNLWRYDLKSGSREQITHFSDFDVRHPSIGVNDEIVFVLGLELKLLDLISKEHRPVPVQFRSERRKLKPRSFDASKFITHSHLGADAERLAVQARGDIWAISIKETVSRNITRTSGASERYPAWSPDGKWIAYLSDASGEYQLTILSAEGSSEARQLTTNSPSFLYAPSWSPDSARIAFRNSTGAIFIYVISTGQTLAVDRDPLGGKDYLNWSPDSKWLTYTRGDKNRFSSVWLYDVQEKRCHQVTSGLFDDSSPVFDPKGDYLFFVSERDFSSPSFDSIVGNNFVHPFTKVLMVTRLRPDVKCPLAPGADNDRFTNSKSSSVALVMVDNFETRTVALPAPKGNLWNLNVTHGGKLVYSHESPNGEHSIKILDISEAKKDTKTVVSGTSQFQISADNKKLLVRKDDAFFVMGMSAA